MKKWRIGYVGRFLLTSIVISSCLLLSSTISLGGVTPAGVSQTTDCRLSPNPDQCYRAQAQQKLSDFKMDPRGMPLNTGMLGLEGPFSAEIKYDSDLSWILGLNYVHMFSQSAGLATKLTGGPNELRANFTTGYAFTKDHQLKLTYEYLTQNLPYNFASGQINEWIGQQSLGAAYQYVIRHEIVQSLELSAYATRARSKDLSSVAFNQQVITPGSDYIYDVNFRRIAGGSENTALATINLFPFADQKTALTLGGGYSSIDYNTRYQNDSSTNRGLAYKAELTHILSPKSKLATKINATAASREHSVEFSHILPKNLEVAVKGQFTAGQAGMSDNSSVIVGVSYPAPQSYSLGGFSEVQELKSWIEKPIVYSARVLAIKDELVQQYEFKSNGPLADQAKHFGEQLDKVLTSNAFSFADPTMQVNYTVFIQKLTGSDQSSKVAADKDYTKDLNLQLVAAGANQAVLQSASADGIPATDSTGQSNTGSYKVTITANGSSSGSAPMVIPSSFKLTVSPKNMPIWKTDPLPDATMGSAYAEVNVTDKVILQDPDTAVSIDFADAPNCVHPDWLVLAQCSAVSSSQCLSSNNQLVPNTSTASSFCVRLVATGNNTHLSATQPFSPAIIQKAPVWVNPMPSVALEYNDTSKIYLNQPLNRYIAENTNGLAFLDQGIDSHWTFGNDGGLYYIQLKTPVDPTYHGLQQLPIGATNISSVGAVPQNVPVNITNESLVVKWTNVSAVPDAEVGQDYSVDLNALAQPLVTTSTNAAVADKYDFQVVGALGSNFTVVADAQGAKGILKSINPPTPVTPAGQELHISLTAVSRLSGKPADNPIQKQFTLAIKSNPTLSVDWTPGITNLPKGILGKVYDQELGPLNLLQTKNSSGTLIADTYDFTVVGPNAVSWSIQPNQDGVMDVLVSSAPLDQTGTITLQLNATSRDTTHGPDSGPKNFNLVIDENPDLSVTWDTSITKLPAGKIGEKYSQDLNNLALLFTKDSGGTKYEDTYSFTIQGPAATDWEIKPNTFGVNSLLQSKTVPQNLNPVTITLHATSKDTGGEATPPTRDFTLTIGPNSKLVSTWVDAITTLPAGKVEQDYSADLNTLGLLVTKDTDGNIYGDIYDFTVVSSSDNNWQINTVGGVAGTLVTKTTPHTLGNVTVTLSASSRDGAKTPAPKLFTITIGQNPDLTVTWTANGLTNPNVNQPYLKPLNPMGLLQTKKGAVVITTDTYKSFEKKPGGSGDADWNISSDGLSLQYKSGTSSDPVPTGDVTLVLTAKSVESPNSPDPVTKTFSFSVKNAPIFVANPGGDIPFDTTGEGGDLGAISQGISLNDMISNKPDLPNNLTFKFDTDKEPAPADWQIVQQPGTSPVVYRLLRKKLTSTSISAAKVTTGPTRNVGIPSIKACVTNSGVDACTSSGLSTDPAATGIKAWVKSDNKLVYKFAASPPAPTDTRVLVAATSDGFGNPNPVIPQTATPPTLPSDLLARVYTASGVVQVLDDTGFAYAKPSATPGYINYAALSSKVISFKAPTADEYSTITKTPDIQYLNGQSMANGNAGQAGNIINLPPITAGDLFIVPTQNQGVNQTFSTNLGANVGFGISNLTGPPGWVAQCAHRTATSLVFKLPANGKSYKLTGFNTQGTSVCSGEQDSKICAGALLPKNPGSGVSYPGGAMQGGGGPFTYDSEAITTCAGSHVGDTLPASGDGYYTLVFYVQGLSDGRMAKANPGPGDLNNIPVVYPSPQTDGNAGRNAAGNIGTTFTAGGTQYPKISLQ